MPKGSNHNFGNSKSLNFHKCFCYEKNKTKTKTPCKEEYSHPVVEIAKLGTTWEIAMEQLAALDSY